MNNGFFTFTFFTFKLRLQLLLDRQTDGQTDFTAATEVPQDVRSFYSASQAIVTSVVDNVKSTI